MDKAEDRKSGVRQRRERLGQTGPLGVVTILVPPAVFDEMEAVFHLPVTANVRLEFRHGDRIGTQTGHEVSTFAGKNLSLRATHFTIDSDGNLAAWDVQTVPDIVGIVEIDPKPTRLFMKPLFSLTSWAGFAGNALAKQTCKASSISGWFAFTWNR